jgi:TrmH family RNA methyltransferase
MGSPGAETAVLSSRSGRVRTARRLARRTFRAENRLFLAEGPQAVREALTVPGCVREVFALPEAARQWPDLHTAALTSGVAWHPADATAVAALSDTVHPQGVVAVCRFLDEPWRALVDADPQLLVLCADVRDPGNAGTVIRCADAAGADGVVLTGSSVDLYNGKTVRASVGSLFHLPLAVQRDTAAVVDALRGRGVVVLAADGAGELDLDDAACRGTLDGPTAWLFGNEAWGLPRDLGTLADHRVRIPIHGRAESLNLATAAAVCLYASARAHRHRGRTRPGAGA